MVSFSYGGVAILSFAHKLHCVHGVGLVVFSFAYFPRCWREQIRIMNQIYTRNSVHTQVSRYTKVETLKEQ